MAKYWFAAAVTVFLAAAFATDFDMNIRIALGVCAGLSLAGGAVALRRDPRQRQVGDTASHEEHLETHRGIAELHSSVRAIHKALHAGDGVSALITRGTEPPPTREDYERLRWLRNFVGAWAWSAKQRLNRDEWPQKVKIEDEQA